MATSGDEGTGIVLTADGDILTNNHVVEAAATAGVIAVTINDGRSVKATIVGRDPTTDLAVIKAAGVTDLHPATLGQDSSLVVGQQVIAIGSPLGLSNTVTSGIISSLNRPVCTQSCGGGAGGGGATPTVLDAIQTDAAINPGNSGGPLVDMAGDVVGVNSAIATLDQGQSGDAQSGSIGVGFSIPIDEARRVVDELEKTGHANHAVLGIGLRDSVDNVLHTPNGALVLQVTDSRASGQGRASRQRRHREVRNARHRRRRFADRRDACGGAEFDSCDHLYAAGRNVDGAVDARLGSKQLMVRAAGARA